MLLNLRIRDLAIIDEVELELPPGFTVITGETGAGKSILVNALTLVLGGRASADLVRAGAETAEVEALFDIGDQPIIRARLEQRDLVGDDPDTLLVRRVLGGKGRAKVVINGRLSTVVTLAEIVRGLVDISGQHEQQSLLVTENHLDILDAYGQLDGARSNFREAFDTLRRLERERSDLSKSGEEKLRRADFLRFQIEEIDRVSPRVGEEAELEAERRRLAHAEKLRGGTQLAESLLYGDDGSAFDKLGKAAAEVEALARIDADLSPVCDILASARREIEDAARSLGRYGERVEVDPARLESVEERVADLKRLCRKHGGTLEEVVARVASLRAELGSLDNAETRLSELEREINAARERVLRLGIDLSESRRDAGAKLARAVEAELSEMDLAGAVFRPRVEARAAAPDQLDVGGRSASASGLDDVEFLWSANRGEPPKALARIASGGELSRLMLAVKTVLASRDLVSLYVFDEVDTGLGGRAADCIGRKIQSVAKGHQAITITHLASIAARADHHMRVAKRETGDRTVSSFELVKGGDRTEEIARMIDGAGVTKATRQAAVEMLARSR
jgi:DNA repair protein RecN (Recombination protein N)